MAQNIIIGGELEPRGASGIALDAQYVIDRTNGNVKQNAINTAVSTLSGGTNYVTIPATSSDTSIGDVFTRTSTTPSTDTLYRIGNWNYNLSPCYNINYYSVYGAQEDASIGSLVPVALSDLGIDDEPTAGSDNLVKSGGVISHYNFIKNEESKIITCTAGESLGRENTVIPISIKAGNQYSIYIESESILSSNPQYYCEFDDGTKLDFQVAPNVIALRTEQKNIKNVFLWISGSIISNSGNITFSIKQTGTINERINIIDSELTNINSSILDSHHDIIYTDFKISGITKTSTLTIVPNISNDFHIDINIPANSEFFVNFKSENLLSANPQLFVRFIDGSLASMAINKNQDWYKITISSPLLIKDVERVGIHIDGSAVQSSGIVTLSVKKEGFISAVMNDALFIVQSVTNKGGYNIAEVFGNNYVILLRRIRDKKIISPRVFKHEMKKMLKHINHFYFDIKHQFAFTRGDYWHHMHDWHFKPYFYVYLIKTYFKYIKYKVFK